MMKNWITLIATTVMTLSLTACGYHLQGEMRFPNEMQRVYVKSSDPYGPLAQDIKKYFKMSHVKLAQSQNDATAIFAILSEDTSQHFLSVNGTEQTRQYNLVVDATFEITDTKGRVLFGPEKLSESKPITIQANQILGSSNEASLYFNHMRRNLAYAIMNRISSTDAAKQIQANTYTLKKTS